MNSQDQENRIPRRRILQWFAAVATAEGLSVPAAIAQEIKLTPTAPTEATGYSQDPVMNKTYARGEVWPLTFSAEEKKAAIALADILFPADDLGPAASEVRVADFIDEWISAPYPRQKNDRKTILPGLKKLDEECQKHFQKNFAAASEEQKKAACDEMAKGNHFFNVFTSIAAGAYYSDPKCWKALGYAGNSPYGGPFLGPPEEVLKQAGVEQTVE
ncbi:gluconate 2-dehydrogenase subunit 3 family protein [Akkermansiaceae bacterium]|nr:gluconate 2-dehydrogenase subunit 3 family protein [Akkermansiaceae bacterium]